MLKKILDYFLLILSYRLPQELRSAIVTDGKSEELLSKFHDGYKKDLDAV